MSFVIYSTNGLCLSFDLTRLNSIVFRLLSIHCALSDDIDQSSDNDRSVDASDFPADLTLTNCNNTATQYINEIVYNSNTAIDNKSAMDIIEGSDNITSVNLLDFMVGM